MNIINALPGIVPTARSFTMGQWPQKRVKMRNGRTVRWALCNQPSGDTMDLTWENITYAQAERICIVWDNNYGIYGSLSLIPSINLTPEILAGTSEELSAFLTLPFLRAAWRFAGSPQVVAAKAGRCTVKLPIKARPFGPGSGSGDDGINSGSGGGSGPSYYTLKLTFVGTKPWNLNNIHFEQVIIPTSGRTAYIHSDSNDKSTYVQIVEADGTLGAKNGYQHLVNGSPLATQSYRWEARSLTAGYL